jgi:hypothetical protein
MVIKWWNGKMAEWRNGGMVVEWWNRGMAEYDDNDDDAQNGGNGGMAEWRNGGMAGMVARRKEWQNSRMAEITTYVLFTVHTDDNDDDDNDDDDDFNLL